MQHWQTIKWELYWLQQNMIPIPGQRSQSHRSQTAAVYTIHYVHILKVMHVKIAGRLYKYIEIMNNANFYL